MVKSLASISNGHPWSRVEQDITKFMAPIGQYLLRDGSIVSKTVAYDHGGNTIYFVKHVDDGIQVRAKNRSLDNDARRI